MDELIKNALLLLLEKPESAEKVLRFVYHKGKMDGMMEMSEVIHKVCLSSSPAQEYTIEDKIRDEAVND